MMNMKNNKRQKRMHKTSDMRNLKMFRHSEQRVVHTTYNLEREKNDENGDGKKEILH